MLKFKLALILSAFFTFYSLGQPKNIGIFFENYVISLKTGASMVLTEYKRDFSGIINEMRHLPAFCYSAGISKSLTQNWDLGYEYEISHFNGFQNNPEFSAYQNGHYKISLMRLEPVKYESSVHNHNLVIIYHFTPKEQKRIIPFVYFKGGTSRILSTLMYQNSGEIIFTKTGRDETKPNSSIYVDNFNLGMGFGNEIIISTNLSLNFQWDINLVNDDNLDGVHNFKVPPPEGYKNFVSGLYGRLMFNVSYIINPDREQIALRKYRLKDTFNQKKRKRNSYPWYKK